MKKHLVICACALALLCSCQQANRHAAAPAPAEEPAIATDSVKGSPQPTTSEVEQRVKAIYDDVARTYGNDVMPNQLKDLAPLYCSRDWNQTVAAVNEADKDDEIGFFEADYWIMGQDYQDISADNIIVETLHDKEATATLSLHNSGNTTRVKLMLVLEDGQWMIDDFIDLDHDSDWKQEMKEYIADK